jgi:peptide-methionine (S)-S-oxide reductase
VGYTGGHTANATYREVCGHGTGHAEAVEVEFDPAQVSYDDLLGVFWSLHNPTAPNRGAGSQYRSAVFVHDEEQALAAKASKEALQSRFVAPIVTEITPATEFWKAEDYHQQYYEKHGLAASCHTVAAG